MADARCKVLLTMPSDLYDRTYVASRRGRVTVPEIIRRAIVRMLADERGGTLSI